MSDSPHPSLEHAASSFDPQLLLESVAPTVASILRADRVGIARHRPTSGAFEVHAQWDHLDRSIARGYHIPTDGTAGDWVREYGCPLIGRDPDEMRPYPRTHEYLERENFASNLLVPIELGSFGKGVVFLLSRSPASFTQDNIAVALRVRDVLEPALRAHLAAIELLEGREATEPDPTAPPGVLQPSLNDVERRHIEATLIRTNWIIEGPRGAARILGIRPSTLRHRLRRLGIRRPS